MKINRISPSSYGSWEFCQHKYFLEQNLKYTYPAGKAADIGTVTHKVLEILALIKLRQQEIDLKIDPENKSLEVKKDLSIDIDNYTIEELTDIAISGYRQGYFEKKDISDIKKYVNTAISFRNGKYDPRNCEIIASEKRVKVEIPDKWATLEDSSQFFLSGIIDLVVKLDDNTYEIRDWKGLPVDTAILTTSGWSTMGDLEIGDEIYDKEGQITKVLGKSEKTYKECYEIEFDDKNKCTCDFEHLWLLSNGKVVSTPDLRVKDKIDVAKPLNNPHADLPIDPYMLGIWLGCGKINAGEITSSDDFIFEEIKRRGYKLNDSVKKQDREDKYKTIFGLTKSIRKLGLLNNKKIPDIYLLASIEQRLDLLRGIMDSCGKAISEKKQVLFNTSNRQLILDTKKLAISLGQRVLVSETNSRAASFMQKDITYVMSFRPLNITPFLLPRKAKKFNSKWGNSLPLVRKITNIKKLDVLQKTQCIKVDSPTSTFLCTENLIPTHNTGRLQDFNTGKTKTYASCHDDPQLRFYHWAATQIYGADKNFLVTIFFLKTEDCFTIPFDVDDLPKTEFLLKNRYEEIKASQAPKLNRSYKCTKFCPFGKNTTEKTNFPNMTQEHIGGVARAGQKMTICDCSNYHIQMYGLDFVEENYGKNVKKEDNK